MKDFFKKTVLEATGATDLYEIEMIQSLWSGYGKIVRYGLEGCDRKSVVIKLVQLPDNGNHPRGWNTDLSHERKIKSYEVEVAWYRDWANKCTDYSVIPHCLALETQGEEVLFVLDDLDAMGYPSRVGSASLVEMRACLTWLANFHVTFMHESPKNLWEIGTYWHLDTRPDELVVLDDQPLKSAAKEIDAQLNNARFISFVHGDAKLANFCFSSDGKNVAAVDFQYVGGGCGMKDVAYFIGSCLYEDECQSLESELLDIYFSALRTAIIDQEKDIDGDALEREWRELFPIAWTDFHRFVKGWSPGHWKIHGYSEQIAQKVVAQLQK